MTDSSAPAENTERPGASSVDGVDVDAVAATVTACPSVSGLAAGGLGSAMTLLPGRRVAGIQVSGGEVLVEVRARWGSTAAMLAREVRAATGPLLAGHRLHVIVADIDTPDAAPDTPGSPAFTAGQVEPSMHPAALADDGLSTDHPANRSVAVAAPPEAAGAEVDPSDRPASPS